MIRAGKQAHDLFLIHGYILDVSHKRIAEDMGCIVGGHRSMISDPAILPWMLCVCLIGSGCSSRDIEGLSRFYLQPLGIDPKDAAAGEHEMDQMITPHSGPVQVPADALVDTAGVEGKILCFFFDVF